MELHLPVNSRNTEAYDLKNKVTILVKSCYQTGYNLSDMLSEHWDHPSVYNMIMKFLITRGPITLIPREATQEKPA